MAERVRARVFGEVASEYDRVRPGYPPALVDDIVTSAGDTDAVEVGAGTGKATVAFAERGLAITAVEPDAAMAGVLAARCAAYPKVVIEVSAFEDYRPVAPYGLLYSAQAWHWTDPDTRWQHAAEMLRPGGLLALFWNFDFIADADLDAAMRAAHEAAAAQSIWDPQPVEESKLLEHWPATELLAQDAFTDVEARLYRTQRRITREDYIAFMLTTSGYIVLDADPRNRLIDAIATVLPDEITLDVHTVLHQARRTA